MAGRKKKKDKKPIKLFTLDTETRGLFGDVFRVGLYDGNQYWVHDTFAGIQHVINQFVGTHECHIYIHNLDFDLAKIGKYLLPTAILDDSIFINNNVAVFYATSNIILHDSLKLLPSSLENLCKDFGLINDKKIDLSEHLIKNNYAVYDNGKFNKNKSLEKYFMNVDPFEKELNEYLKFDCISLFNILIQIQEISGLGLREFINCPTTASLAMKVYKTLFPDDYEEVVSTNYLGEWGSFIEDVVRQGYYGGRTEVFIPELANGYHYDVNSLYPYVMKVNEFPTGYYDLYDGNKARTIYYMWKRNRKGAGMAWVNIHVPEDMHIPPLPVRHDKKLIFPVGKLSGVWTFQEIEMAERYGCKVEKIEQIIFFKNTEPVFKNFVEKFEEIKNNSEGAKRTFAKLMQNSLYGKFGMNRERDGLKMHTEELEEELIENEIKYRVFYHPFLKRKFIESPTISKAEYIQPHIAAFVTSYARCLLYESIMHQLEKGEIVAYCDTDSMATSSQLDPELEHDKEYGKWKLEAEIKEAIFLQPKLYFEEEHAFKKDKDGNFILDDNGNKMHKQTIKAKGIPKDVLTDFTKDTYINILNKIKNGEERIEIFGSKNAVVGDKKEKEVRQKFATLLKNEKLFGEGKKGFDTPQFIKKGINLRAKQKREMDYVNNSSKPRRVPDMYGVEYEKRMLLEVEREQRKEIQPIDPIKDKIKEIGFIKIPIKNEQYYEEYKNLSKQIKSKYFRKKGIPLDVWANEAGYLASDLMETLRIK